MSRNNKKVRAKTIVFCDDNDSSEVKTEQKNQITNQNVLCASNQGSKELSDLKGLCMNCEIREKCDFPKPLGGVWHCKEYK